MSIDHRLRSGLRAEGDVTSDLAALLDGWADVEARAEQQRVRDQARWVAGFAAVAVLVVVAAVTWWPQSDKDVQPIQPVPSPTASTPSATPSALEGSWSTGPVPAQGILDHLDSVGLGQWGEGVLQDTPAEATIEYRLKFQGGRSTHSQVVNGGAAEIQDVQTYEIDGSRVTLTVEDGSCSALFAWEVQGDRLRLLALDDDCPPYRGTPDVALLQGLYAAYPFNRTSS